MAERKPLAVDPSSGFPQEIEKTDTATFGGLTIGGHIAMSGYQIVGLAPATIPGQALAYGQNNALVSGLDLAGNKLTNLDDGTVSSDAVNKGQLDTAITSVTYTAGNGLNLTGNDFSVNVGSDLSIVTDTLQVLGVPGGFTVSGVSTGPYVTSANLNTLVNGSNADTLHTHSALEVEESERIEFTFVANGTINAGDPVRFSSNNTVTTVSNTQGSSRRTVGIARTSATNGQNIEIAFGGAVEGIGAGAWSAGDFLFLGAPSGLTNSLPTAIGAHVMFLGIATNANDMVMYRQYLNQNT